MIDTKKLAFLAFSTFLLAPAARAANLPLQWQAVTSPNLRGYRVYYGTSSRSYTASVEIGNTTQHTLTGLAPCTRYYVAVKAISQSGIPSSFYSNEIVGLPTPQVTQITPSTAEPGQALTVSISGAGFDTGAALVIPGEINILSTSIVSCNQANATISLAGNVSPGSRSASVRNLDLSAGTLPSGFTVVAASAPTVRSVSPAPGGMGITIAIRPSVQFSERMMASTVNASYVRLLKLDGTLVPQAVGSPLLDSTGTIAVIVPASPLAYTTQYRVALTGGTVGLRDAQGTLMAASYTQSPAFQTGAPPPSQGTGISNEAPETYARLVAGESPMVEFALPMDPKSLTPETVSLIGPRGVVAQVPDSPVVAEDTMRVTITLRDGLEAGAMYRARIMGGPFGVRDATGQPLRSSLETDLVMAIPTPDVDGPVDTLGPEDGLWPIATDPVDRTADVPFFVRPAVTFNRRIDPLSLSPLTVRMLDVEGKDVPQAPGSPILEASRRIVTVIPAGPLQPGRDYRIEVAGGFEGVRDEDGAVMKGTYAQVHGFGVEALGLPRPEIESTMPGDEERKVDTSIQPTVTFTEALDPASVDASTIELLTAHGRAVPQAEGSPFLDGSGTVATIVPAEPLRGRAFYWIRVVAGPGGVRDFAGHSMSPTSVGETRFRTRAGRRGRTVGSGDGDSAPSVPQP